MVRVGLEPTIDRL